MFSSNLKEIEPKENNQLNEAQVHIEEKFLDYE